MSCVLIRKENLNTGMYTGKMPCEDEGRDWSDASRRQEMPKIAINHQKLGERQGRDSSSQCSEGTHSANALILGLEQPYKTSTTSSGIGHFTW